MSAAALARRTLKINDLNLDLEEFDYKADSTSYKIILGYRFMGFLAVEGSYIDFGKLSDSIDTIEGTVSVENDLKGIDAFAMGMLPLGIADLFAKIGFVSWDSDIRAAVGSISELDTDSGTDLVYGIGAQLRFKGLAVRARGRVLRYRRCRQRLSHLPRGDLHLLTGAPGRARVRDILNGVHLPVSDRVETPPSVSGGGSGSSGVGGSRDFE